MEKISRTENWSVHGSKTTKAPTRDRPGPKAGSVGSVKVRAPLMGSPGSPEVPPSSQCVLALQPWWLGSTSCCHGTPAGRAAHWTQSWHLRVGLGGPRGLNCLLLSSHGGTFLSSRWGRHTSNFSFPPTSWAWEGGKGKSCPRQTHVLMPTQARTTKLRTAFTACLVGGEKRPTCVYGQACLQSRSAGQECP